MSSANPLAATVEDYDSDAEQTVYASIKAPRPPRAQPKPQKRSPTGATFPDAASDSGYSSRTAATIGSADSIEKPLNASLPQQPDPSSGARNTRASPPGADQPRESQPSTKQPTQRPSSKPPSRTEMRPQRPSIRRCSEPNCPHCVAMNYQYRKSPLEVPWNLDYPPVLLPSVRPTFQPPSPLPSPHPYPQYPSYRPSNVPTIAAPQPRRRSSSQSRSQRPGSYHPGVSPEGYWVPVSTQPRQDPGPPLAPSAYANPAHLSTGYAHYQQPPSPTAAAYYSGPLAQGPPLGFGFPSMRPTLAHRSTDNPSRKTRPISMYEGLPQVPHEQSLNPDALMRRPPSRQRSSKPSYDPQLYANFDRHRMPPPPLPPAPKPPLRYSSDYYDYSESSDSSGASPHNSTRTERPESRSGRRQSHSTSYHNSRQQSREQSENNRGRSNTFAAREQRLKNIGPVNDQNENPLRRARTISRPAHDRENNTAQSQLSSKEGMTDGFRIEVQRQGMDLDVNGQRISVVPKDGGVAELIFGSNQGNKSKNVKGSVVRSQSATSERRKSRSSKHSSDATTAAGTAPAAPAAFRRGSASSKNPGYTTDDSR